MKRCLYIRLGVTETMKKYLSKALFYKEMKNFQSYALMALLTTLVCSFDTLGYITNSRMDGVSNHEYVNMVVSGFNSEIKSNMHSSCVAVFLLAAVIGAYIVGVDRVGRRYETLSSMNFTKLQIILTKWVSGAVSILSGFGAMILFCIVLLVTSKNLSILPYGIRDFIILFLMDSVLIIFSYTFGMLMECLSSKPVFAGIIGFIFLILPVTLPTLIGAFLRYCFGFDRGAMDFFANNLDNKIAFIYTAHVMENKLLYLGIFIPGTIICFIAMVYAFKNAKLEKSGYPILFKPLRMIFKIGVSICSAMVISLIISSLLFGISQSKAFISEASSVTFCAAVVGIYFLVDKMISLNEN